MGWSESIDWDYERTRPNCSTNNDGQEVSSIDTVSSEHLSYRFIYRLGSILHDFDQCNLILSLNNYTSLVECLIRTGSVSDALKILTHEVPVERGIKLDKKILTNTRGMLRARKLSEPLAQLDEYIKSNHPQWHSDIVTKSSLT